MSKQKTRQPSRQVTAKPASSSVAEKQSTPSKTTPVTSVPAKAAASLHRPTSKDAAKYERRQVEREHRALAQRRAARRKYAIIAISVLLVLIAGLGTYFIYNAQHTSASTQPPPFSEPVFDASFPPVDNVYCDQLEQSVSHIHAHLSIWIDGQQHLLEQGTGIGQTQGVQQGQQPQTSCFYWLHTHDSSGVIHMESPVNQTFTLSQFFDIWQQQFGSLGAGFPSQLLLTSGWTAYVNGKPYHGSIGGIPMHAHDLITIAFNSPNAKPDTTYAWSNGE